MRNRRKKRMGGIKGRRRSKMSGGKIDFTNILAVVGGAVIAGYVNKLVPVTVNDKIVAGGKVALGIVLPMLSKNGQTKNILSGVGAGMIAVGSVDLLKSFGAINGDFDIPVINGDDEFGQAEFGEDDEFGQDEFGEDMDDDNNVM